MKPKTKLFIRDSFSEVEVVEPGFDKAISAQLFSNDYIQLEDMQVSMDGVSCDFINGFWSLNSHIDYTDWNTAISSGSGYGYSWSGDGGVADFHVVQRDDAKDRYLFYPYTVTTKSTHTYYPWVLTSDGMFEDDQGIAIEVIKKSLGEAEDPEAKLFIAVQGITPNVVSDLGDGSLSADTIIFEFPLYEKKPIRYGFCDWDSINDALYLADGDINTVCLDNVFNFEDNISAIENWLMPDTPHVIMLRRIWNYLLVSLNSSNTGKPIYISNNADFSMQDINIKVIQHKACPIYVRIGDVLYDTSGTLRFKMPVGYPATEVPTVFADARLVYSDTTSTITQTNAEIIGLYLVGELTFTSTTPYYTPVLYRFDLCVPPKFVNTTGGTTTEITSDTINYSITKAVGQAPTANISLDNSIFNYTYADLVGYIGKQIRIDAGYDGHYNVRFTGIINDISFNRNSPASCQVTISAKGITSRLDKVCMYRRIYDGEYHQRAVADICQMASIANIITDIPENDFDKLGYGIQNPKYNIEIGDNFRSLVDKILSFSGYVLEEDELGNAIYTKKYWRYYGLGSTEEYGYADADAVVIQTPKALNTTTNISALSIQRDHNDLRNTVIVMGQADNFIPYQEYTHEAFRPGDPIVIYKTNTGLLNIMKHEVAVVIRDPSLSTPEQVDFVASTLLRVYADAEQKADISLLGDEGFYCGSINTLTDLYMIGASAYYFYCEGLSESFDNNVYLMRATGTLFASIPSQYG
jgi:hypothetical protein